MVVRTVRFVIPAYLRGKGPNYLILRETYIVNELRKYTDKRQQALMQKRARLEVKNRLSGNI